MTTIPTASTPPRITHAPAPPPRRIPCPVSQWLLDAPESYSESDEDSRSHSPTLEFTVPSPCPMAWQRLHQPCIAPPAWVPVEDGARSVLVINELVPCRMQKLTIRAPQGVYIGVGTERCFMAAALNKHVSQVIMADANPHAVFYNQINVALLYASQSREHYLRLRLHEPQSVWQQTAEGWLSADAEHVAALCNPQAHAFWCSHVRHSAATNMQFFNSGVDEYHFGHANYLFNNRLYNRLAYLAHTRRLHPTRCDLSVPEDLQKLAQACASGQDVVGIIDLSILWMQPLWQAQVLRTIKETLAPVAKPSTMLLGTTTTRIHNHWSDAGEWPDSIFRFTYFGVTFGGIEADANWQRCVSHLARFDRVTRSCIPTESDVERVDAHLVA